MLFIHSPDNLFHSFIVVWENLYLLIMCQGEHFSSIDVNISLNIWSSDSLLIGYIVIDHCLIAHVAVKYWNAVNKQP